MSPRPRAAPRRSSLLVGICGGSGSGKSWLARFLRDRLGSRAVVVCQDWYYRDNGRLPPARAAELNFDHPDSIEGPLFRRQLSALTAGRPVLAPIYDYATHARLKRRRRVEPADVVIVDGLFLLQDPRLRGLFDLTVFIEVPDDERLLRRVRRDVVERRVALEETLRLYERFVRPMHRVHIQPFAGQATFRWRQEEDPKFPQELLREVLARLRRRGSPA